MSDSSVESKFRYIATAKTLISIICGLAISLVWLLPRSNSRLLTGDDFLLYRDITANTEFARSFWRSFWQTGQDKWRPGFLPLIVPLVKHFRARIDQYQMLNQIVLVGLGLVSAGIAYTSNRLRSMFVVVPSLVVLCRFTLMAQLSIYGLMELLSTLWFALAVWTVVAELNHGQPTQNVLRYRVGGVFALTMATFTHERFIFASIVFALVLMIRDQELAMYRLNRPSYSWAWYLAIPIIHVAIRTWILNIDVLKGGGETAVDGVSFWWIRHLADGLLALFGHSSGVGIYYDPWTFRTESEALNIGFILSIPVISILCGLIAIASIRQRKLGGGAQPNNLIRIFYLSGILILLLPAATVRERIEGRWLLAPFLLLLWMFLSIKFDHRSHPQSLGVVLLVTCVFGTTAYLYRHDADLYRRLNDQIAEVEVGAARYAGSDPWVLVVNQTDSSMPTWWQLGLGGSPSQLENPPVVTELGTKSSCEAYLSRCVVAQVRGLSRPRFSVVDPNNQKGRANQEEEHSKVS